MDIESTPAKHLRMYVVLIVIGVSIVVVWFLLVGNKSPSAAAVPSIQEKQTVLALPANNPTEQTAYQALVNKLARESATLEVGAGCTMTPLVIKLKEGSALAVHNGDAVPHVIAFEDQNFFSVSAGQTRAINLKDVFSRVAGAYRYRCSDISTTTNVGVVYIVR